MCMHFIEGLKVCFYTMSVHLIESDRFREIQLCKMAAVLLHYFPSWSPCEEGLSHISEAVWHYVEPLLVPSLAWQQTHPGLTFLLLKIGLCF